MTRLVPIAIVLSLALAPLARANVQTSGQEQFPGNNELSVHMGYQAGFAGNVENPSGFKLFAEYAHGFTDLVWLDVQLNQVFGFGTTSTCIDRFGNPYPCGGSYSGGWDTEIAVGIKLKIKLPIPLVLEVPIDGGIEFMYDRACGDNGVAAPVIRPGFNAHYFLTNRIGVGAGFAFAFGPGFHGSGANCQITANSYVDAYAAFDAYIGAEFILGGR